MKTGMGRGGPRVGSGRPKGSGGPRESIRRNRVVAMLTDGELAFLKRLARDARVPVGTMLYEMLRKRLRSGS